MIVLSRRPIPATTGNFAAAGAPTRGSTTWPPCVWPDSRIGTLDRERAHRLRDIVVGDQAAAVHVGDEADAETRERGRQSGDPDSGARHFELVALVEESVSTAAGDDADAACEGTFEDGAAS